ncbi:ribosomal protein L29 [Anaerotruncus sp. CAG:390]|nr:ribosomal protein L29 [Anaerotruncus sp. CAG:390]
MKISEIREMTSEQLDAKLKELKEELFNLRFQLAINQLENTNRIGEVKKDIARVMTVLNDKNAKNA